MSTARAASAGRSRRRILERFNLGAGVSCSRAITPAQLLLLLTRFSRQLPLLSCLMIVRLRHDVLLRSTSGLAQPSRLEDPAHVRRGGKPEITSRPKIGPARHEVV